MNNKYKILLVDNGAEMQSVAAALSENGAYQVIHAASCSIAKLMFSSYMPDLIIQELVLPDCDGTELVRFVRRTSTTPIIVLSSRKEEADKVTSLDMGANDYVTKPFGMAELLARVRSALRNNRSGTACHLPNGILSLERFTIDYDVRRVIIDGKEVILTQTEYNIIVFLSEHYGRVVPYHLIINAVWGGAADKSSIKKLQVNMANLRGKLRMHTGGEELVVNEPGVGYRIK